MKGNRPLNLSVFANDDVGDQGSIASRMSSSSFSLHLDGTTQCNVESKYVASEHVEENVENPSDVNVENPVDAVVGNSGDAVSENVDFF